MEDLSKFIGCRNSTRNLSEEKFNEILPELAEYVSSISVEINYSDNELRCDWDKLNSWGSNGFNLNSTSRVGLKLCEHFFPNFYDIENSKGKSFRNLWTSDNLKKILVWNRNSHSTPYLSELKRGIYFCCGMTKSTMYRPQMSKMICNRYSPDVVFDPCAGWGGRMLGAVSSGAYYIAFEPNTKTFENLNKMSSFLGIQNKVRLICDDAMNMEKYDFPEYQLILTSPPYFNVEVYTNESTQSIQDMSDYDAWSLYFLNGIINKSIDRLSDDGYSCWNVAKVGKNDMWKDVDTYHLNLGFDRYKEFYLNSSKRQSLQTKDSKKSEDLTVVYKKE